MRAVVSCVVAIMVIGLGSRLALGQTQPSDVPALESIYMFDALTGWAVTNEPGAERLLHTSDGGTSWMDVTPTRAYRVDVLSSLIAWVSSDELFRTVDGGRTWRQETVPGGWVQSIHFINPRDGWVVSVQGANMASAEQDIYRSPDGGQTWVKVADTNYASKSGLQPQMGLFFNFAFLNATTGWVTGYEVGFSKTDAFAYLYVTRNSGRTWQLQRLLLPAQVTLPLYSVTKPPKFFAARDGILPVFYASENPAKHFNSFAVFYVTHDGGATWMYTTPVSVNSHLNSPLSFADVNHGWVAEGGALFVTNDGGRQWTTIRLAHSFGDVNQLDFISSKVGWAVTMTAPYLLKTADGGHTWAPVVYTVSRQ